MTALRLYSPLLAVLALAGCNLAPRYAAPAAPVPATFPAAGKAEPGAVSAQDVDWRDFYADERLCKVLQLATDNNRDLRVAALNVERAQALYRIQRASLLPRINANGQMNRQRLPADVSGTGSALVSSQYGANVGVSAWEVDFFGRIRNLKDAALAQYLATEQAHRSALIALRAEVAGAYLTLAGDREALRLAQDTLASQNSTDQLNQRRFQVGSSSEIDARRSQISVETAKVDVATYTRLVALDQSSLELLVGGPVPADMLPEDLTRIHPFKEGFTASLTSEVLVNRPDILAAENQLKAANANIGAARAAFFPSISLTTSIGTLSAKLSGMFESGSKSWTFNPAISVPIFDYGTRRANLKVSKIDKEIALAQYEKAIQTGFKEVNDALVQRQTLSDQKIAQEALTQATATTYRLTKARYDVGLDGSLSVLDAQRSLNSAQQALVSVRRAELNNLVALYKALGGGIRVSKQAAGAN